MSKEPQKNGLLNLPTRAAEFIKLIIGKMRYRRKVRAEVLDELTAHFEDALRDCKSDEEKQQRAKQLIEEFGDAKLLAILMRRAKRRCRPLWRTVTARTLQAAVILIVCFILYVAWFLSGKPQISIDYLAQFNQMAQPTADDSQNAAPLYDKAIELYEHPSDSFLLYFAENYSDFSDNDYRTTDASLASRIHSLLDNPSDPNFTKNREELAIETGKRISTVLRMKPLAANPAQKQFAKTWIADRGQALDMVTSAGRKPYYWRQYQTGSDGSMFSILMPRLSPMRNIAIILRWRANLHAENADFDKAFSDIETCYRLGRHLKTNKIIIEQLVGIAIEAVATETVRDILGSHQLTASQLETLQFEVEQIIKNERFTVDFQGEKLMILDEIQRCFTRSGHLYIPRLAAVGQDYQPVSSEGSLVMETVVSPERWLGAMKVLFAHPDKDQTRKQANKLYDFFQQMADKTPAKIRAEGINIKRQIQQIIKGNTFLEIWCPAYERLIELSHRGACQVKAAIAVIAVLRYRLEKGTLPDSLEQLIRQNYLNELPIDPYADKPLIYRRTRDSFTLYSVGENFTDDGGKPGRDRKGNVQTWRDKGDAVFWPVQAQEPPKP